MTFTSATDVEHVRPMFKVRTHAFGPIFWSRSSLLLDYILSLLLHLLQSPVYSFLLWLSILQLVWKPLLAAFTVALNNHNEPNVVAFCLEVCSDSAHNNSSHRPEIQFYTHSLTFSFFLYFFLLLSTGSEYINPYCLYLYDDFWAWCIH